LISIGVLQCHDEYSHIAAAIDVSRSGFRPRLLGSTHAVIRSCQLALHGKEFTRRLMAEKNSAARNFKKRNELSSKKGSGLRCLTKLDLADLNQIELQLPSMVQDFVSTSFSGFAKLFSRPLQPELFRCLVWD